MRENADGREWRDSEYFSLSAIRTCVAQGQGLKSDTVVGSQMHGDVAFFVMSKFVGQRQNGEAVNKVGTLPSSTQILHSDVLQRVQQVCRTNA